MLTTDSMEHPLAIYIFSKDQKVIDESKSFIPPFDVTR
jgi:hypothetical protein